MPVMMMVVIGDDADCGGDDVDVGDEDVRVTVLVASDDCSGDGDRW